MYVYKEGKEEIDRWDLIQAASANPTLEFP
jgi:hypothetical protein